MKQGGYTYRWAGLSFVNSSTRVGWSSPFKDIFLDLDGSLTGFVNGTVLPFWGWNNWTECPRDSTGRYSFGSVCRPAVQVRRIVIDNVAPGNLYGLNLAISSAAGAGSLP